MKVGPTTVYLPHYGSTPFDYHNYTGKRLQCKML